MKFSILLYFFYFILKLAAWKDKAFKNRLREKNFTMLIKTKDGEIARNYTFSDGNVSSESGDHQSPDFALVWIDASTGYKVMAGGSPSAFMKAIREDDLIIRDNASVLMWFMETMNRLQGALI